MRINTTSLSNTKTLNARKIPKSIYASANKNYKREYSDNFTKLGAWITLKSGWTFGSGQATTSQPSSNYTLSVTDVQSKNIDAAINLNQSGAGIAFWIESPETWWAAIPYYTTNSEQYISSYYFCNCQECCWGYYCRPRPQTGCHSTCGQCGCWSCPNYSTGTRYNYYLRILQSVNGAVSIKQDTLFNTRLNDDTDDLTGMRIVTNGQSITVYAKNNSGNFIETTNSYNSTVPTVGLLNGIIFAPGGYAETSTITSFTTKAVE
jgi:hypothetical protein